jgi:broad specificity phosphatase PhoE
MSSSVIHYTEVMTDTKILFIRHGETLENIAGEIQGQRPGRLSDKGRRQAAACARILKLEKTVAVYTSDLRRAIESARIAVETAGLTEAKPDIRLREQDCYRLAGRDKRAAFRAVLSRGAPPEETQAVVAFIEDALSRHASQTVAAFTHFGPIYVVLHEYSNMDANDILRSVPPGAVVALSIDKNGLSARSVDVKEGEPF